MEDDKKEPEINNSDNDFIIGQGFNIEEESPLPQKRNGKHKKKKSKGIVKTLVWIISIIIVSCGIAFGVIYAGADYMGIGFNRGKSVIVEIESGSSTQKIASKLKESGAVKIPSLFRLYSKLKHFDSKYKYGVYSFNNEAGYEALAEMLMKDGAKADSVHVTIPEMSTVDDIAKILETAGVCTKDDFIDEVQNGTFEFDFIKDIPDSKVYYRLEGYLFPDSYDFYSYDSKECAHLAVVKMLSTLEDKISDEMKEKTKSSKYSFHQIMTLASIVELEAGGSPDEMSNVAAVFYNRLESKDYPNLGSSPTRKYPYGDGKYNTYECIGLPPGPLCSPSIKSIEGAINPTPDFNYYYFVTDASMKFYYRATLAEHNAIIAKLKAEKNWIYEE